MSSYENRGSINHYWQDAGMTVVETGHERHGSPVSFLFISKATFEKELERILQEKAEPKPNTGARTKRCRDVLDVLRRLSQFSETVLPNLGWTVWLGQMRIFLVASSTSSSSRLS